MFDTHKLKELRLSAGESQATVASVLNVTQQAYANYESGRRKPDIMVISKLAKHFDVMIHDFFTDDDIEKPASVDADGLREHMSNLTPALREQLIQFLKLSQAEPERAIRFLEFVNQELESLQ